MCKGVLVRARQVPMLSCDNEVTSLLFSTQDEQADGSYVLLSRSHSTVCLTSMWIVSFLSAADRSVRFSKSY